MSVVAPIGSIGGSFGLRDAQLTIAVERGARARSALLSTHGLDPFRGLAAPTYPKMGPLGLRAFTEARELGHHHVLADTCC